MLGHAEVATLDATDQRIIRVLRSSTGMFTVQEIEEGLAMDGRSPEVKRRTLRDRLKSLQKRGLVGCDGEGRGRTHRWYLLRTEEEESEGQRAA